MGETRRVTYRDASGTTHEAHWPIEVQPTTKAVFRGVTYELAGIADGTIFYTQKKAEDS